MREIYHLIEKLDREHTLNKDEWAALIAGRTPELAEDVFARARVYQQKYYGHEIFVRGLIEMTSYCRNDCIYCGLRRSNRSAQRYRLSREEIMDCAREGYRLGFRTFVLQGGEDPYYSAQDIAELVAELKKGYPDCAVTLSLGERERRDYELWYEAGADRYLLRHETADFTHYAMLHPPELSAAHRQNCLRELKDIGYQVGTGFMVGSPGQTAEYLAEDMLFLKELNPEMVGIGPFIPHHDTPFAEEPAGTVELTLYLLGLIRLMIPDVLLPATTALGTIDPLGREKGVQAGANVIMPNLSPRAVRKKYELYDNKICTGEEAAECRGCLQRRMDSIGYQVVVDRGDVRRPA
jgi:biotin synthase